MLKRMAPKRKEEKVSTLLEILDVELFRRETAALGLKIVSTLLEILDHGVVYARRVVVFAGVSTLLEILASSLCRYDASV